MTPDVPFNDLQRYAASAGDRLEAAAGRVFARGWYLLGPETTAFEEEWAAFSGVATCIAVANGTDALEIALRSVGCGPGDDVIVVANAGMYATTACLAIGATPRFADVDRETLLMDPVSVGALADDRTRAVVATHLYGSVVDVDALRDVLPSAVAVVEDCAQAHGAIRGGRPVGSLGDIAAFSFYPTKNLGAAGDAGAVVTDDADLAARARALRQYGWERRYESTVPGGRNSRMDEIQAAVLRELSVDLAHRNARRAEIRARYVAELADNIEFVGQEEPDAEPVVHLCVARSPERDALVKSLGADGVSCAVHYPVPDHLQPTLADRPFGGGSLPVTEDACREVLSLPCFPDLRDDEVDRVIEAVRAAT